jgi:hypothetical protein
MNHKIHAEIASRNTFYWSMMIRPYGNSARSFWSATATVFCWLKAAKMRFCSSAGIPAAST